MSTQLQRERRILEACLTQCKRQLDRFRSEGDDLQASLTEADQNRILDELGNIYNRLKGQHANK